MKKTMRNGCLSLIFALFAGVAMATQTQQTAQLDLERINTSIRSALTEFNAESTVVETLMYSLNAEKTDIANDAYLFDVELALPASPWGNNIRLDAHGSLGIKVDLTDADDPGIHFTIDAYYKTDALAMLKYKVTKVSHCEAASSASGLVGVLWERHCEFVGKLPTITSVSDLHGLLSEKIQAHKSDVTAYLAELNTAQKGIQAQQETGASVSKLLAKEVELSGKALEFLNGVVLAESKDGFSLKTPAFSGCPFFGTTGISMEVTATEVHAAGDINLKFGKSLYAAARPVLMEVLQGLEKDEAFAKKLVKLDAEVFASMIANMLDGAEPLTNEQQSQSAQQQAQQQAD